MGLRYEGGKNPKYRRQMNAFNIKIKGKERSTFKVLNIGKFILGIPFRAPNPLKLNSSIVRVLICLFLFNYANNSFAQTKKEQQKINDTASIGFKRKGELSNLGNNALPSNKDQKRAASEVKAVNSKMMLEQQTETPQLDYDQFPAELKQKVNSNKANGLPLLEGINKVYRVEIKQCTDESECNKKLEFMLREHDFISLSFREITLVDLRVSPSMKSEDLKSLLLSGGLTFNFIQEFYTLGAKN